MEAENKKVSYQEALEQLKRMTENHTKAFNEKRRKQRNGLIRSGYYENERPN